MNEIEFITKHYANIDQKDLVFFEVGACNFAEAIGFKQAFPAASVYAFEPDKTNLEMHAQNASNQGVIVAAVALSDEDSEARFYASDSLNGQVWKYSGSIIKPNVKPGTVEGINHDGLLFDLEGYDVQVVRLDTFCELNNIPKIDYLHVDVQGAEHKVVNGLGNLRPPYIYAETCEYDTYDTGITLEIFDELMADKGYAVEQRYQYDTLYRYNGL